MEHAVTPIVLTPASHAALPTVISDSGERVRQRYLEFFLVTIRNPNTRLAYGTAAMQFLDWCQSYGLTLDTITPVAVAAYIESHPGSVARA